MTRRLAALLAVATLVTACGSPRVELIPPSATTRAAALSERHAAAEDRDSRVATSLAPARPAEAKGSRRTVRLLAPPVTRTRVAVDYTEIDEMPRTLRRIGGCESSGDPTGPLNWLAQNRTSTASGAFQVLDSTWWSTKGTGWSQVYGHDVGADQYAKARYAPPSVQLHVVLAAFNRQGTGPWVSSKGCWS